MGVTNYDNLPENVVESRLREAQQAMRELKGTSQSFGDDSLYYHRRSNVGEFAWSGRVDSPAPQPGSGGAFFEATVYSPNVEVALSDLVLEVFVSSDGITWTPYTTLDSFNTVSPNLNYYCDRKPASNNVPNEASWIIGLIANLNARAAFKLQALSTDDVSISVVRTG